MIKANKPRHESHYVVPVFVLCCGVFLAGQTALRSQSIEGSWIVIADSNSCDKEHKGATGRVTTIVRRGPNTFSFVEAGAAAMDPADTAALAAAVIVGTGPDKYTYKYHRAETRTTTEVAMEWTLRLVSNDTLQIDGWAQEYDAGKTRDVAGVIPLCILHSTLRRGSGASGSAGGGGATNIGACSSPEDCMRTDGYDTTMAVSSGLLGLLGVWGGIQMASLAGVVGKALDAASTALAIADTRDQFDKSFLGDPVDVSKFAAIGAIADLGEGISDLLEEGDATTEAIMDLTGNSLAKVAIDAIPPVGLYDAVAGGVNLASGAFGGQPVLPTVSTEINEIETALAPSDAIPQPAPMDPIFVPPDANWAQNFVDQTGSASAVSSLVPPPPESVDAPPGIGGNQDCGDDS